MPDGSFSFKIWRLENEIGRGTVSCIYICTDMDSRQRYACKKIIKQSIKANEGKKKLMNEIKIHRSLKHPGIVRFAHFFDDDNAIYIILEECKFGSLQELITKRKVFHELEVQVIAKQLVATLVYLRGKRIIHRDFRLSNMLLSDQLDIKICDFGYASQLETYDERRMSVIGAPHYIAPEILRIKFGHSFEADIWSLGVSLYIMLTGKPPFAGADERTIHKAVQTGEFKFPKDDPISEEAEDLITKLLFQNPQKRPVLEEIVCHPFFSKNKLPRQLPRSSLKEAPEFKYLKDYIPVGKIKNAPKEMDRKGLNLQTSDDQDQRLIKRNNVKDAGSVGLANRLVTGSNSTPNLKLGPMRQGSSVGLISPRKKPTEQKKAKLDGEDCDEYQGEADQ